MRELYHRLTRTHTVLTGRKTPMRLQSPCQYTKYCLRAFHCLNVFLLRQNCCAPGSDGFSCDFWFLRRRRADARQGEKDKKHLAHSMQSPAKRVCMEKEEGDCLVQLLPQGGSGTVQASSDAVRRVCSCQLMVVCVHLICSTTSRFTRIIFGCKLKVPDYPDRREKQEDSRHTSQPQKE